MVTKPGLAGSGSANFSGASVLENCERHWKQNDECRSPEKNEPFWPLRVERNRLCRYVISARRA
ncbi:MAG: hypothetical protein DMG24_02545 [Acidobacteria bacterium]|nr:MAG: hypothetical protein DMG24_02545 [Acidobacteriota bacterium]